MTTGGQGDGQGSLASFLEGRTLAAPGDGEALPPQFATAPLGAPFDFVAAASPPVAAATFDIAALTAGSKWSSVDPATGRTVVTYSFANPAGSVFAYTDYPATLAAFGAADQALTRKILATIESMCNVHFVEVPDNANVCGMVRYGYSQLPASQQLAGYAFYPAADPRGGDVWLGTAIAAAQWDGFRPELILHETLHALGLKHPFDGAVVLPAAQNVIANTVMSYSPVAGAAVGSMSAYPDEPMPLDISTLQYLYGAPHVAPQDVSYDLSTPEFQGDFSTIYHAGGHVTLDASGVGNGVSLDLNENARSSVGARVVASGVVNGTTVTSTYTATLAIAAGTVVQEAVGSSSDDSITGNAAGDLLIGGGGNDHLTGGAGNDVLVGGSGDDTLDGAGGLNEADYAGPRAAYDISRAAGTLLVTDTQADRDGTDQLLNVQRLKFADGWLAFDTAGDAGQAYRLYQAAFARTPDPSGLGFWTRSLDAGTALQQVAQTFVASPEFAQRYGSPDDAQFVTQLYANVLHRSPDASGLAFHLGNLAAGAIDRAGLLALFSESPENQAALIGTIQEGMFFV